MRGALICNAETGERMDDLGLRGVRVSRMAFADPADAIPHFENKVIPVFTSKKRWYWPPKY